MARCLTRNTVAHGGLPVSRSDDAQSSSTVSIEALVIHDP
jgi:hypothetical protein